MKRGNSCILVQENDERSSCTRQKQVAKTRQTIVYEAAFAFSSLSDWNGGLPDITKKFYKFEKLLEEYEQIEFFEQKHCRALSGFSIFAKKCFLQKCKVSKLTFLLKKTGTEGSACFVRNSLPTSYIIDFDQLSTRKFYKTHFLFLFHMPEF